MRGKRRKKRAERPKGMSGFPSRRIVPPGTPVDHQPRVYYFAPVKKRRTRKNPYPSVGAVIMLLGCVPVVASMVVGSFAQPNTSYFYGGLLTILVGGVLAFIASMCDMRGQERRQQPPRLSPSRR